MPPKKRAAAIDHEKVVKKAVETLKPFLVGDDNLKFRRLLEIIVRASESKNSKMVHDNAEIAINSLKELAARKNIPITAPPDRDFIVFAKGEEVSEKTAILVTLHSLYYISLLHYPAK